jgi:hypothetical protein
MRPKGPKSKGEQALLELIKTFSRYLLRLKTQLNPELLNLTSGELNGLAASLVEMAEDLHFDVGLWRAYEQWNKTKLYQPLPGVELDAKQKVSRLDLQRVRYALRHFLTQIKGREIASEDPELDALAPQITEHLRAEMVKLSKGSVMLYFWQKPNDRPVQVLEKLNWLAAHSYFFRQEWISAGKEDVIAFTFSHISIWEGIQPWQLLSEMLGLDPHRRAEVRSWENPPRGTFVLQEILGETWLAERKEDGELFEISPAPGEKLEEMLGQELRGSLFLWEGSYYFIW